MLETMIDTDEMMPVLFVGHGNPMNALEKNTFTEAWQQLGRSIPKPTAILCVSAHWETKGSFVTIAGKPSTIHDFYGFPEKLFNVQYPAPGSPELAGELMKMTEPPVQGDLNWGLDHGTWSILKHLYPAADVPVIQLSLNYTFTPEEHLSFSHQLQKLRRKGVLIMGSGNMIHNLRMVDWNTPTKGYDWAEEANELFKRKLQNRELSDLVNYPSLSKSMHYAIPTPEHFLPLIYALGQLTDNDDISFFNDQCLYGSLSMTSVLITNTKSNQSLKTNTK